MVFRTTRFRFVLAAALSFFIASAFSQPARDPISDAVGSSAGEFRVDESGSATYAIPLYVLPGTAGTAPSLTLAYSSNSGEGALGKGWNLSGNSSISRCRATRESGDFLDAGEQPIDGYPDPINFSLTDKFCLDGQRLLPELTANGTVVANVFRLELDAFTRVTAIYDATPATGPRAFRVQRRDGTTGWYGDFNGCALSAGLCSLTRVAANRADAYLYANTLDAAGNVIQRNEASAWAMNRMIDSNGNYIDYRYLNDPDKSELLLERVEYTGFARYSNAAGTHAAVAPYASIVMQYSDLNAPNWQTGYSGGSRFVRSKRLENITSLFGSNPVRFYSLSYQSSVSGSGSDLLSSFLECRDSTQAVCLRPTTFIWSAAQTTATLEKTASSTALGELADSKFGDIDGDGRTELVWARDTSNTCASSTLQISKATKDAQGRMVIGAPINSICTGWDTVNPNSNTFVAPFWQLLDYNGDGRDDLLLAQRPLASEPTFWRVYLASSTFVGFEALPSITTQIPVTIHTGQSTSPGTLQFGDLNGDGVLDAVYPKRTNANPLTYRIFARFLERNAAGVFEYSPEYSIDYESAVPSYIVCGDCLLRSFAKTGQNLRDINGDGRADLLMTVAAGENPMRIPELFRNQKIWMSIASRDESSASLSMKFITGTGSDLNASDAALQVEGEAADFNGDGLSDLLYCYKPNPAISNELCTSYLGTGLRGAKAYRQIGVPFDQRSDRHLIDINNDGRTDVLFRPGADITDGPYQVLYANSEGVLDGFASLMPGCSVASCAANAFQHGSSFFMDFDGDASLDFLALQSPPNINDNIRTGTSAVSSQFAPKDVILTINNGYGAQTTIDYLPLTNRDIYRRDQNSRNSLIYGRKSPVQDLLMPMYVVSKVTSSAPTQSNPNALSTLNYRYAGAKVQGGGRGFLGFREVVTFDGNYDGSGAQNCGPGQTTCHMASVSTYSQAFPYIGAPYQSMSYVVDGAYVQSACRGAGRGSDNCTQLNAGFPTLNISINRQVKFSGHAMACQSANGSVAQCPAPFGGAQCFTGAAPQLQMSEGAMILSNGVVPNSFNPGGKAQGLFVYLLGSQDLSYELQGSAGNRTTAEVFAVNCYADGLGNLTLNQTTTAGIPSDLEPTGGSGVGKLREMTVQNVYVDDLTNWRLGRLMSASVSHGVKQAGELSFTTLTRDTQFTYQSASSKLLNYERISAASSGGDPLSYAANTYYDFDVFGNKTAAYTCSSDISETLCRDPGNADNPMRFHPTSTSIRRFARTQFEADGRFAISTSGAFYDPAVAVKEWTERITGSILSRDEFGEVTSSEDANGVRMNMLRGALGRDYYAASEAGSSSTTTYRWCTGQGTNAVTCPSGAIFRRQIEASGAPKVWSYFDVLGREIQSIKQSNFDAPTAAQSLVTVCTSFDSHGRTVKATEPVFATASATGEPQFTSGSGCGPNATSISFDILGRERIVTQPDAGVTQITYGTTLNPVTFPGGQMVNEVRSTVSKRAADNASTTLRTWVDVINAVGEKVSMSDPSGFTINQKFDEVGSLSEVSRQASGSALTVINSITYDKLGRKMSQVDPDMGNWSYRYNAMNEVVSQTDALGQTISHKIDALGRVWQTTTPGLSAASDFIMAARFEDSDMPPVSAGGNIIDTTTFDTAFAGLGLPESNTRIEPGAANFSQTMRYDALSRVDETATLIDAQTVTEQVVYDAIGRPFKHFTRFADATGSYDEGTETAFNSKGYPHKICRSFDASTNVSNCVVSGADLYYQAIAYSQRGQVTQEKRANNVSLTVDRSFNTQTGRLAVQNVNSGSLQSWQLQFDRVGNLSERFDARTNQREVLTYDKLDRLTTVTRNGAASLALTYDSLGNICSKTKELTAAQTYSYGAAAGCSSNFAAGLSPHQVKNAFGKTFSYNDNGDMTSRTIGGSSLTISYDATRLSRVIAATGKSDAKSSFWYSPGGSRYKRIDEKNGSITRTVRYFGAVEKEVTPTKTLIRESIGGFLLINREVIGTNVQRQYRYLFADHLGSVDLITNETGAIIERMSFDAHGARRQDSSWSQSIFNYQPDTTLRGFTGQEMLDDLGLVHMNARIYDPELGKFLQADSEVEDDATQGLNRYSYCLNNPLSLTDPTGHRSKALGYLKAAVAIAVSIWLPGSTAIFGSFAGGFGASIAAGFVSGVITGGLQGGLEGAFSAGLFYGIGSHFAGLKKIKDSTSGFAGSTFTRGVFAQKVLAHATAGGVISVLQGGKFGHGFVSAGITEAVSPTIENLHNDFAQVAASAMVGGSTSVIAGGKFGNGAATGAMQMAFNQLAHPHGTPPVDSSLEGAPGYEADYVEPPEPSMFQSGMEGGDVVYELGTGAAPYNYDVYVTGDRGQSRAGPYRGSISPDTRMPGCGSGNCPSIAIGSYAYFADKGVYRVAESKRYLMLRLGTVPSRGINSRNVAGVWVHMGYQTGTYAQGCLTVHQDNWANFISNFAKGQKGHVEVKQ